MSELAQPTQKKKSGEWLLVILAALSGLYLSVFAVVPELSFLGIAALVLFGCSYAVLLSAADNRYCLIPAVVSLLGAVGTLAGKGLTSAAGLSFVNLLFAFLYAAAWCVCQRKKASKSVTFAVGAVVLFVHLAVVTLFVVYDVYGKVSVPLVREAIDSFVALCGDTFRNVYHSMDYAQLPALSAGDLEAIIDSLEYSVRSNLLPLYCGFAMAISGITAALYAPIAKLLGEKGKICLDGRQWQFKLSRVSVTMFYIVYAGYFISYLFTENEGLRIAFWSLSFVLSCPFAYRGLCFCLKLFTAKFRKRSAAVAVITVILVVVGLLLGGIDVLLLLLAFVGASVENRIVIIQSFPPQGGRPAMPGAPGWGGDPLETDFSENEEDEEDREEGEEDDVGEDEEDADDPDEMGKDGE